ncbi:hypothetical protein ACLBX9_25575 [Methylobacterium sp. A49B]|uniref:Uncharacterized protein n=1 Tax=Methylobacterium mesophilicum SR1.6/6 TaxID=908290 RepID=A0A6B9FBM4_9HYPH|nr:hypothetical protein [Methylobacterium mesophilicum]QGY00707.1 hypothetical protein MMSR116_01375 [Methylobacterium mesophilicum SR1.6/6]
MPQRKSPARRSADPGPVVGKPIARVGLPTRLAAIQDRYRRALTEALDRPHGEQGDLTRAALATLLAEKAALGVRDGEEAAGASDPAD